jgi:hypothetical protein
MWFILGVSAYTNHSAEFTTMRQRMKGRLKELTGGPPQNNAFVMRIGGYIFIEYGMTGNACYIYPVDQQPFNESNSPVSVHILKKGANNLKHMHAWEQSFDVELRRLLGSVLSPPNNSARAQFVRSVHMPTIPSPVNHAPAVPSPAQTLSNGEGNKWPWDAVKLNHATMEKPAVAPLHIPKFLPDMAAGLVDLALVMCNRAGIVYKNLSNQAAGTWVHEQAKRQPEIRAALERAGFTLSEVPDRRGYWKGKSISLENISHSSGTDIRLRRLLDRCDEHAVRYEDLRASGRSLWVYAARSRHEALVRMLIDFGFQFSARNNAYYFDDE